MLMASVQISKTDLRNIISQLEKYISLGRKVTAPTDTSQRNRIRMAIVLKRKLEACVNRESTEAVKETIIIGIKS